MERHPSVEFWGIEPHGASAEAARAAGYTQVEEGSFPDIASVLAGLRFDAIFFNDVLEHMVDPAAALVAARELLALDGRVIASIPNTRHIGVWWPLIRRGEWTYTDYGLLDRTHLRFFTRKSMISLFEDTHWTIQSISGIARTRSPEPGVETWKVRWLSRVTRRRVDDFFFAQYVVTATRSQSAPPG
jgi:2-polyprenyl-3-methyl-5-hydroxy-6-metoxy-1,4-benzoquinol methylase